MATHEVLNQPPPLALDPFATDAVLRAALSREGAAWARQELEAFSREACGPQAQQWAAQANENPPRLRTHDRYGNRVDELEFHPSWHALMRVSVAHGVHGRPWREPREGAHVARAAMMMVDAQNELGHGCPISMTYSAHPALARTPALLAEWGPRITGTSYDPRSLPAHLKGGALIGMAMTEKQGGSDVRANTTRAVRDDGGGYRLTGHKWFCSAPMSDAFLVLAQAGAGLSCFLLPRFTPDGARNRFFLQRLKDKLGNRSNASGEVELDAAYALLVGEEGRGVQTILEMVNHTRLDCVIGSAAMMRRSLTEALHHVLYRKAFGRLLIDQPVMRNVLADLALESEAATTLMMRLARGYDRKEAPFRRLATAVSKFWVCKRAPAFVAEALECLGGNGYVEESGLPRIYREAPLNSIWEGSGNVMCLDVLRAVAKEPESLEAVLAEIRLAAAADRRLDAFVDRLGQRLARPQEVEARRLVEDLALALQGSLLVRFAAPAVADAFCASRLDGDRGQTFGTLPSGTDLGALLSSASPG